jgi:hypothetical protein
MKNLLLTIAFFSVLLLIGCQENSLTDPVQENLQKNDDIPVQQGTILLKGDLADPREQFISDEIKHITILGAVKFEHRLEDFKNDPTTPQQFVSLHLSMDAKIQDLNSPEDIIWSLSGDSKDIINVSDKNSNSTLYKYYTVQGNDDGMRLVCKFVVKPLGVDLNDYWLQLQSADGSYPDISVE